MRPVVKRLLMAAVFAVVLLALAGFFLLQGEYDSERLGRAVLERASAATGLELAAEGYTFRPLSGLEVRGLTARGPLPAGHLDARLEELSLRHEFWPLLSGRVVVHEVVLERPVVTLTPTAVASSTDPSAGSSSGPPPATAAGTEAEPTSGGLELDVHTVRLEDAEITLHSEIPEEPPTVVRGMDLTLDGVSRPVGAPGGLAGLESRGTLTFEEARLGELVATEGETPVELRDGHLRLTDGRLLLPPGPFEVREVDLDLTRDPFAYRVDLRGEPLATGELLGTGVRASEMAGLGDTHLVIQGGGEGSAPEAFLAQGGVEVEGGTLPALAILSAIDALVDGAGLVGEEYQPLDLRFDVARGRVTLAPFQLVAGSTELGIEGWADLDGRLDLSIRLVLPRAGLEVKEVPRELLDALTDEAGRLHLPLEVSGDASGTRVVPDPEVLKRAVRGEAEKRVRQEVEKQLTKGLRSLFGGDEEDETESHPEGGDGGG